VRSGFGVCEEIGEGALNRCLKVNKSSITSILKYLILDSFTFAVTNLSN